MKNRKFLFLIFFLFFEFFFYAIWTLINKIKSYNNFPPAFSFPEKFISIFFVLQILLILILILLKKVDSGKALVYLLLVLGIFSKNVLLVQFSAYPDKAGCRGTEIQMGLIKNLAVEYYGKHNFFPSSLVEIEKNEKKFRDGWGFLLDYKIDRGGQSFSVVSVGKPQSLRGKHCPWTEMRLSAMNGKIQVIDFSKSN